MVTLRAAGIGVSTPLQLTSYAICAYLITAVRVYSERSACCLPTAHFLCTHHRYAYNLHVSDIASSNDRLAHLGVFSKSSGKLVAAACMRARIDQYPTIKTMRMVNTRLDSWTKQSRKRVVRR